MELKEFVKTAIADIMDAVEESITERIESGRAGFVNPKVIDMDEMEVDTITFDVALTAGTSTQGQGKVGLSVLSASVDRQSEASTVSRVEFTLAVSWPYQSITDAKKLRRV